jgi:hypothetical protein
MTLRQKQSTFSKKIPLLILYAYELGYEVTIGDVWAHDRHKHGSFHYKKLAIDLNLFKNGRYLRGTKAHEQLGLFWESLGGSWGGRYNDGNHYSWGENKN